MVDEYSERLKQAMDTAGVDTTALAKDIGVSYQAVRKALTGGRFGAANNAKAAKRLGVTSDWLATGKGQRASSDGASTAPAPVKGEVFRALSTEEKELIEHWRHLLGKDRRAKLAEIAALAKERLEEKRELFEEAGLTGIMERAANAARRQTTATSVDPNDPALKQQSLLPDDDSNT